MLIGIVFLAAFVPVGIVMEKTGAEDILGETVSSIGALFSKNFTKCHSCNILSSYSSSISGNVSKISGYHIDTHCHYGS